MIPALPVILRNYTSKKFKWFANGPDYYDCFYLTRTIMAEVYERYIPDYEKRISTKKSKRKNYGGMIQTVIGGEDWEEIKTPRPADVVLMRTTNKIPDHLCVVVSSRHMMHIDPSTDSCIEDFTMDLYSKIITGFYRWNPK